MTRDPYADPPRDPMAEAFDDYRAAFGAEHMPHFFGLPASDMPIAATILRAAIARGRPVRGWTIMRACGLRPPPPGAEI